MNGCMFLNRSFLRIGQALALDMNKRYGVANWCAYAYGKPAYNLALNNGEIKYAPVLVDDILTVEAENEIVDDDFLKAKEKEYGTHFWLLFAADRHMAINWPHNFYIKYDPIFNYYQIKQQLQYRIKVIEKMLDQAKPDFIVMSSVCAMGSMLLYLIAKKRAIKTVILDFARLDRQVILTESIYGNFTGVDRKLPQLKNGTYDSPQKQNAVKWIDNFRNKPTKPHWAGPQEQLTSMSLEFFLKNLTRKIINSFKTNGFPQIYGYSVANYLKRNYLMWLNRHRLPKYDELDPREQYAFFPLHYEPELSLMVYAPQYQDQLWLIKNIAQSLPIGMKLCVKEHPSMIGLRNPAYYRDLKKIPNLKLLAHSLDSIAIIKNSSIVFSIGNTTGWEAVIYKKPVVVFSPIFYSQLSVVNYCRDLSQLPDAIVKLMNNYQPNDKELIDFTSLILEDAIDIDLNRLWYKETDIKKIADDPDLIKLSDAMIKMAKS
jgi:hypothetical protein